ncbi:MAG TPA: type II secretion system F family protein [Steroidobacter sp.]|uniref:type II secretion system F family protein n=1 Tax=Steroidobacter sp. TaxID=1978227 RepID=UPI002EDAB670
MDPKTTTIDVPVIIIALVAISCVLIAMLMSQGLASYRRKFVSTVEAALTQQFIVTNVQTLFIANVFLPIVGGAVGWFVIGPVGLVAGIGLGIGAPRFIAHRMSVKRVRSFIYQLPDALLALSSALRAGSNLTKGLELLATRQPPPLSQEFTIVLAEYRVGRPLAESLDDLRKRIDRPELDLMNTAINVARRVGGNLADTLESLAKTLQEKAAIEGKIEALTAMGRAQGWVVGLLPVLVGVALYFQQPDEMTRLFTQWYGWITLAVVAGMMAIAVWVIRKIVNIDV